MSGEEGCKKKGKANHYFLMLMNHSNPSLTSLSKWLEGLWWGGWLEGGIGNEGVSIRIKGARGEEGPARLHTYYTVVSQPWQLGLTWFVRGHWRILEARALQQTNTSTLEYWVEYRHTTIDCGVFIARDNTESSGQQLEALLNGFVESVNKLSRTSSFSTLY